ncbi:putative methyltransferase tdiE [Colletotrichum viniferum]|nr:putative methyltransferase tdiE [Colletotrichum viniferum]
METSSVIHFATARRPSTTAPDDGSSIDERMTTYTASLTSSMVDYPTEYGRRYHAFRQGGAVEMGDYFPNAEIIGNDLSPIQTPWVPPNVKFEIDDVESSWVSVEKYDCIFCRYIVVAIADWPKLIQNIYEHLNPGGWVEFQEMDGLYYSEDNTYTEDLAVFKWNREYLAACDAMGRTARPGSQVEGWVRGTGFDNVESQKFKTPIGPWAKDLQLRDVGMICLSQLLDGLEGFTLKLFCGFLGKTQEEVLVMLSHVRKELKSGAAHILVNQ